MKEHTFLDTTRLSRRDILRASGTAATAFAFWPLLAHAAPADAPAETPHAQAEAATSLDINEYISAEPARFGNIELADGVPLGIFSKRLKLNMSLPVQVSDKFDNEIINPPTMGMSIVRSNVSGGLIGFVHSGYNVINRVRTPLPGQHLLQQIEGDRDEGLASYAQQSARTWNMIAPESPSFAAFSGNGQTEHTQLVDIQAFRPDHSDEPFLMKKKFIDYVFKQGTEKDLTMIMCATSGPVAAGLFADEISKLAPDSVNNPQAIQTALQTIDNPFASFGQTKEEILNTLYPELLEHNEPVARELLARYMGCKKEGNNLIPLSKRQLLQEFGVYFYDYGRVAWRFRITEDL